MDNFVILSGCSGGGKSTLLAELERRGHATIAEPGRRIVAQERAGTGAALPWVDMRAFATRAIDLAIADWDAGHNLTGWVFFDRSLVDACIAFDHACPQDSVIHLAQTYRYNRRIFLTPPWPALFESDDDRQHDWAEATAEYERLVTGYDSLGYEIEIMPRCAVSDRADWIFNRLKAP